MSDIFSEEIKRAESMPTSRGRNMMLKYLRGEKLTQREAIVAKCFECMGGHFDGRIDCKMESCSLYPYMPYRDTP